jgi:hypothetical protein
MIKTLLCIAAVMAAFPAYAQISQVTEPLDRSAPVKKPVKEIKPATAAPEPVVVQPAPRVPLLTIKFDRRHVYFEKSLRQAISGVENTRAGTSYDVVSTIPVGATREQNQRFNRNAGGNLDAVLMALNELGVGSARVHISTVSSDKVTAQEIAIFLANETDGVERP